MDTLIFIGLGLFFICSVIVALMCWSIGQDVNRGHWDH
jgi:hypothetical protein